MVKLCVGSFFLEGILNHFKLIIEVPAALLYYVALDYEGKMEMAAESKEFESMYELLNGNVISIGS